MFFACGQRFSRRNGLLAIAEAQWLLVSGLARALWYLEPADRTVLYLCCHRLRPNDGNKLDWKGNYGQ